MPSNQTSAQLYRSETDRYLGGVCGGIGEYFNIDSTIVRLLFIASILLGGSGVLVYLILWLIIPSASADQKNTREAAMTKAKEPKPVDAEQNRIRNSRAVFGLFLIGLGIIMLLENFGIGRYLMLDKTWPSIFIILGLMVLSR